ncbi:MAG TPA: hypothetical protein VJN39_07545 [Gemmatimonadales bacterium]|nr:hypothetical protein [Gemmatimonadales bacterium]
MTLCGIVGPLILVGSFVINPAPPAASTIPQLRDFAVRHHDAIVLGGWLQGIGSLLIVVFAIGLVHLADATSRMAGWLTLLAGALIVMVSLVEVTFYLGAVQGTAMGDTASALASDNLRKAVQHVFLIAPALLLPLAFVLRGANLLPRVFAHTALALGATLQTLGLVGLLTGLQTVVDVVLMMQAFWFVAAAVVLLLRSGRFTAAPR